MIEKREKKRGQLTAEHDDVKTAKIYGPHLNVSSEKGSYINREVVKTEPVSKYVLEL